MIGVAKTIFHFIAKFWKSILWIGFILYGTLTPTDKLPKSRLLEVNYSDLVIHFGLWGIMALLLLWEMRFLKSTREEAKKQALHVFYICLGIGFFSEMAQLLLITSRSGNIFDFLADSIGSLGAFSIMYLIRKRMISSQ